MVWKGAFRSIVVAAALVTVLASHPLAAQPLDGSITDPNLAPTLSSFSGSPLLLDLAIPDPERTLNAVSLQTDASTIHYRVPPDSQREELRLYVSPFLSSGVHDLEITADHGHRGTVEGTFGVGFVDFVWGRDNLSFGNNAEYRSVIGTFGEVLDEWLQERFGVLSERDRFLLIDYMYSLFGSNTGRCYAFAGTEVRYWRWPELLPDYYDSAHDLRGWAARYQREMNYLQFDIVFDHFLAGQGTAQIARPMSRIELHEQALEIERRITAGEPVAVGFAGPDLHHSMLVFGFVRDTVKQTVDLLVANNWKSDEKLNIHSRDAEIIRIHLSPGYDGRLIEWRYEDGIRDREIDRLFVVDVRRGPYEHDRALLDDLVDHLINTVRDSNRTLIVVEEVAGAALTDGTHATGRLKSRTTNDLEQVWFERIGRTYRFSFPEELALVLDVSDDAGARVLTLTRSGDGTLAAETRVTAAPAGGETIVRRFELASAGLRNTATGRE